MRYVERDRSFLRCGSMNEYAKRKTARATTISTTTVMASIGFRGLSRPFGKNFVRTLDILGSHANAHIYTQSAAIEVVDDRAESGRPVVLSRINYARIFLRDLTDAELNPCLFEPAANRLRLVYEDSVTQNRDVFLIAVWHCPLLSPKLPPGSLPHIIPKPAADAPRSLARQVISPPCRLRRNRGGGGTRRDKASRRSARLYRSSAATRPAWR